MSNAGNPVSLAMSDALSSAGFTRDRSSWFRTSEEVIEVVSLQKSQWGKQYYINYGLWLRSLGDVKRPRVEKCHIQMRIGEILEVLDAKLNQLLDLESNVPERREALAKLLNGKFVPFADSCRTLKGIKKLIAHGDLGVHLLTLTARRALGVPQPA